MLEDILSSQTKITENKPKPAKHKPKHTKIN